MWRVLVVLAWKATAWLSAAKGLPTDKAWRSPSHHRKYLTDRKIPRGEGSPQQRGGNLSLVLMVGWPHFQKGYSFSTWLPLYVYKWVGLFHCSPSGNVQFDGAEVTITLSINPLSHAVNLWSHLLTVSPKCTKKRKASCFSRMGKLWDLLGWGTQKMFQFLHYNQEHHWAALGCPKGTHISRWALWFSKERKATVFWLLCRGLLFQSSYSPVCAAGMCWTAAVTRALQKPEDSCTAFWEVEDQKMSEAFFSSFKQPHWRSTYMPLNLPMQTDRWPQPLTVSLKWTREFRQII